MGVTNYLLTGMILQVASKVKGRFLGYEDLENPGSMPFNIQKGSQKKPMARPENQLKIW